MSNAAVIAIAIAVAVVLAAIVFVTTARRSDVRGAGALSSETAGATKRRAALASRPSAATESAAGSDEASRPGTAVAVLTADEAERAGDQARRPTPVLAPPAAPAPWVPPDPEVIGVSRRQFFNRATVTLMGTSIGAFTVAGFVAFLWPTATGGFGQVVSVGKLEEIKESARANSGFFYAPSARTWFTEYPAEGLPDAETVYDPAIFAGMRDYGLVALYQKCPHLGCRVPDCASSRWFECPCHGSQYNQVGEKKGGPAPRGMDRFSISVDGAGNVDVDTGTIIRPDRRSARTPPARRPRARTASPAAESTDASDLVRSLAALARSTRSSSARGLRPGRNPSLVDRRSRIDHGRGARRKPRLATPRRGAAEVACVIALGDDVDRLVDRRCSGHRVAGLRRVQRPAARKELGSELELAPNRKPYYDDEDLEGRRLELVQFIGVLLLIVIVIGLPLYWVFEPSRQAGAREAADSQLVGWGGESVRADRPTAGSTAPAATAG